MARGELKFKFHNMTEENIIDVAEVIETYAPSSTPPNYSNTSSS